LKSPDHIPIQNGEVLKVIETHNEDNHGGH